MPVRCWQLSARNGCIQLCMSTWKGGMPQRQRQALPHRGSTPHSHALRLVVAVAVYEVGSVDDHPQPPCVLHDEGLGVVGAVVDGQRGRVQRDVS